MKPAMTMLMLDRMRQGDQMPRSEYGSTRERRMIGYDRDYEREHTRAPSNTYGGRHMPPMDGYDDTPHMGGYGLEARRRRDKRGRYMMGGMDYDDDDEEDYSPRSMGGNKYGDIYARGTIYAPGAMNKPMGGMMGGDMSAPVDEQTARMWVMRMDGGEHFKPEQAEQYRTAIAPNCDKNSFYVVMNMMYSDYNEAAKKLNADRPEFYAWLSKSFLDDKDAKDNKLRRYMRDIAQ